MQVRVVAPATSANLGSGFDVIAVALDIYNEVTAEPTSDGTITVTCDAGSEPGLLDPDSNMVCRGYAHACNALKVPSQTRGVALACVNRIPIARGLGSSAAAALSGVLIAAALHDAHWDDPHVLALVTELEGHPDNAAAALLGGATISIADGPTVRFAVHEGLHAVLFVPDIQLRTDAARTVLPHSLDRADAVYNLGRCALLVHALESGRFELLRDAMDDRWHQPQRTVLLPYLPALIAAALDAGACGAALSGAGPSVIAFTDADPSGIADTLQAAAHFTGITGHTLNCALSQAGAHVEMTP